MSSSHVPVYRRGSPRCECCGYLVHQREHLGCIRAAAKMAAPEPATAAVDAVALDQLRVTVDAYDKAWADDMPQRQKIAALHMAEAARRLLTGGVE